MNVEAIIRGLALLADGAEDRKIDLEADFPTVSPGQLKAIDEAQARTAQAMNQLQLAAGALAEAFHIETTQPERNTNMNDNEKRILTEAAGTLAALLDLVQGFACESGTEALGRYCKDPVALMDRAAGVLGKLKRATAGGGAEEGKK